MKNFFVKILIALICFSCQGQFKNNELIDDDFTVSYPSDLILDRSGQDNTRFILKTDIDSDKDVFIENVNLAVKPSVINNFDSFVNQTINEVNEIAKNLEYIKPSKNGLDYLKLKFELTQNNISLTFVQHYYYHNKNIYVLTFSSETSNYSKYLDKFEIVMSSFTLK